MVDNHFGHCDYYTIYEIDEKNNVLSKELLRSQGGCGCKSNVSGILKKMGVTVLIAGNMGQGAFNMLSAQGIEVIRGCEGVTDDLIQSFLNGGLVDVDIICQHHDYTKED